MNIFKFIGKKIEEYRERRRKEFDEEISRILFNGMYIVALLSALKGLSDNEGNKREVVWSGKVKGKM